MGTETNPESGQAVSVVRIPSRRAGRRRDRHGRGIRGPLLAPLLPGFRTRSEQFDDVLVMVVAHLEERLGSQLDGVQFAVESVPPSDPAPWEQGAVPLGRYFPADGAAGLAHRIVIYRRPIQVRAQNADDLEQAVREVVVEHVAHLLGRSVQDIDPELG